VVLTGNELEVQLRDGIPERSMAVDCIVDMTYLGAIIGVEILDLRRQLNGGKVKPSTVKGNPRWSYDEEIDAFYLHVTTGPGQVQRKAKATVLLDSAGRVVRILVPIPWA
jgi:hypothetical protein